MERDRGTMANNFPCTNQGNMTKILAFGSLEDNKGFIMIFRVDFTFFPSLVSKELLGLLQNIIFLNQKRSSSSYCWSSPIGGVYTECQLS